MNTAINLFLCISSSVSGNNEMTEYITNLDVVSVRRKLK